MMIQSMEAQCDFYFEVKPFRTKESTPIQKVRKLNGEHEYTLAISTNGITLIHRYNI
jgi:hypothetical protein